MDDVAADTANEEKEPSVVAEKKATKPAPQASASAAEHKGPIVLFDGVCNFCNGAVQFIVDHERKPDLGFAPLQSDLAATLLEKTFGKARAKELREGMTGSGDPDTIILLEAAKSEPDKHDKQEEPRRGYTHSAAGLRIARHLRAPWSWAFAFVIVPRPIRDFVYRFIAKNRYRWFGKSETCRIPTPELRKRFLA